MSNQQTTLIEAQTQLELARTEMATVEARARTEAIKQAARPLLEHYDTPPTRRDNFAYDDPYPRRGKYRAPWSRLSDREEGKFYPLYETEQDLAWIRGESRGLGSFMSIAIGAMESLVNYVIGCGFTFTVQAADGMEPPESLVAACKRVVDRFLDDNDFVGDLDREIHNQSREDGEHFLALSVIGNRITADVIDPDQVVEPASKRELEDWLNASGVPIYDFVPSWKFGVLTSKRRTHLPIGYHVIHDSRGEEWEYVPDARMMHIKRNVPRKAKRGVSDYVPVQGDIEKEAKLRENTLVGASVQAAIAFIREHVKGVTQTDIEDFVANSAAATIERATRNGGTRDVNVANMRAGTVKDVPDGMKYHAGPLGSLRSPIFIEVAGYALRSIGIRWTFPEYMISGDASNANYSSTLVAESPFVKAREFDQEFYKRRYVNLLWKVLRMAWELGWIDCPSWRQLEAQIEIKVDAPEVASRDQAAQATKDQSLNAMGVKSKRTIASEHGLDYDAERKNMAEEPAACDCAAGGTRGVPGTAPQYLGSKMESWDLLEDCGTGEGGFKSGNSCGGESGGGGAASRSHNVKLPSKPSRLTIQVAGKALDQMGYKLGKGSFDLKTGKTSYTIKAPDGKEAKLAADQIAKLVFDGRKQVSESIDPTAAAALQGALESVDSTDEARDVLRSLWKGYP